MTAPRRAVWAVRIVTDRERAHEAMQALEQADAPEAAAVSCFDLHDGKSWLVEALYGAPPERETLLPLLGDKLALTADIELLADEDWVAKSLDGLPPVVCGRLFVHGSHDAKAAPPNAIPVTIEAGLAFGTGHHGTTYGCLEALERLRRRRNFRKVLDLGCGSGVLAIVAAKLWPRARIWAADIDPEAVAVTRANARANHVPHIRTIRAPGLANAGLRAAAPFDLITANILARPLTRLAPEIAAALKPGGIVVLSGLLADQERPVRNFYESRGLTLDDRRNIAGWVTLSLSKPARVESGQDAGAPGHLRLQRFTRRHNGFTKVTKAL
ncbi:MAG: 50S ribosomal protein L11 methyltransferase [Alphaproteobacteria bacterium]